MVATQKLPQILQLNPASEIVFLGPFDRVVTSYLELKNPSGERVCFKVKTTAPRRYCVRPNNGTIEPNGKIRIAIMLQPMDADSQTERSKHKFMVQSTIIKGDDNNTTTLDEIWQNATPDEIMDSKLRCVFQTPEEEEDSQARQKLQDDNPALAGTTKSSPDISSTVAATIATTNDTTSQQMESTQQQGRQVNEPSITTSTPVVSRATSSTTKSWGSSSAPRDNKRSDPSEQKLADKSMASSHNLTSSFLQPLSDDYKIVLVSLAMLFLGVILGKYII